MRLVTPLTLASILCTGSPAPARAAAESAAAQRLLGDTLRSEQLGALHLIWTSGIPGSGPYRRLHVDGSRVSLEGCSSDCKELGGVLQLSSGEQAQLVSRLRAAELGSLRDSDNEASADRQLAVTVSTTAVGSWRLGRAEWPSPADGYGVAELLDELGQRVEQTAALRTPLPTPRSAAELAALKLQLRLRPRSRPGGLVVIEQGELRVSPEVGTQSEPKPLRPFGRPLRPDEQEQLLKSLQAAQLDTIDSVVPRRAQPAIGDEDGRLVTLHLLVSDSATPEQKALHRSHQPRGVERYLVDLQRSAAGPLVQQLLGYLVTESAAQTAAPPPSPSGRAAARRH